jgi:ferritin heavy chain
VTGVVFEPFKEVAPVLASTAKTQGGSGGGEGGKGSFVRGRTFTTECEAAINEQINIEYNISYVYHALSAFFDRDTVSLPGFAEYFRHNSLEEREHAQKLIDLQNTRGGRVKLNAIVMPETEYDHPEKGDALYAMELSLSLEKLNFDKLLHLWEVVDKHGDPQLTQYIEDMLQEQAEDIKKVADYVSQLRRVGKGHGVWAFDHELYEEEIRARATPNA